MNLQNTTALVTGGAKRVGLSISLALARAGADVIIHYHNSESDARDAVKQIEALGRRAYLVRADLGDHEQIADMLTMIERECPPVNVLVNSASVFYPTPLPETSVLQWNENLDVNLRAPFLLAQSLGHKMVQRGRGKIVNITDCSIRRPYTNYAPYLVSKAGLMALTEVLALELAPQVQVNAVAPGTVLLPHNEAPGQREQSIRRAPLKKIGSPDDVAAMVLHLIENGDFMTGGYYAVDGGAGAR
jgi:NAD(P)-dependent dehydrogenase (short-subunit alcohol dehydrogenase family)